MEFQLTFDAKQLSDLKFLARELPAEADGIARRSINAALKTARSLVVKTLSANMGIRPEDFTTPHAWGIRKSGKRTTSAVQVKTATKKKPFAVVMISGQRIPIVWFGAQQTPIRKRPKDEWVRTKVSGYHDYSGGKSDKWFTFTRRGEGVTYKIGREGRKLFREAFMGRARRGSAESAADSASGHMGVFVRKETSKGGPRVKRLKIKQVYGPSVPEAALKDPRLKQDMNEVHAGLMRAIDAGIVKALKRQARQERKAAREALNA